MPGTDCELITAGFLGQPVNTITTLAFIAAGIIVGRHRGLRWAGVALMATGVGSFLFHGPMPFGSLWAHDTSLAWLILVVAGLGHRWERWTRLPGLTAIGSLLLVWPRLANPVAIVLVLAAVITHSRRRTPGIVAAISALAAVAVFGRLGSTEGPLCDPESIFQPHGVWHLGAAMVLAWWLTQLEGIGSTR